MTALTPVVEMTRGIAGALPGVDVTASREKRAFIQRLFTRIAPRYDVFNRLASCGLDQHWRRVALARGGIAPGQRILDVCAGTGDLAMLAARRQRGAGTVLGADLNGMMLAWAQRKQRAQRLPIAWVQADALALPFQSDSFDRVTIAFSTRNLGDLTAGIREMLRVVRPGGQLIILETGRPRHPWVRVAYYAFLFTIVRIVGLLVTGELWPFTYLATSVRGFLTPQEFVERLRCAETTAAYVPLSCGLASLFLATKRSRPPDPRAQTRS